MDDSKKIIEIAKEFIDCCLIADEKQDDVLVELRKTIMTKNDLNKLGYDISKYFSEDSSYGRLTCENRIESRLHPIFYQVSNFNEKVMKKYKKDEFFDMTGMKAMV